MYSYKIRGKKFCNLGLPETVFLNSEALTATRESMYINTVFRILLTPVFGLQSSVFGHRSSVSGLRSSISGHPSPVFGLPSSDP